MESQIEEELLRVLKREVKPAFGVTGPSSVALASSKAYQVAGGEVKGIRVIVDPAFFKTSSACVIPGTNETGYALAAALGILIGDASSELEVLKGVNDESVVGAKSLLERIITEIAIKEGQAGIYVEVIVNTSKGVGKVVIKDTHTNIVLVEANEQVIYRKEEEEKNKEEKHFDITSLKVADLTQFVQHISFRDIKFVLDAIKMNKELAREGLTGQFGMGVGASMAKSLEEKKLADDPITFSQILVASACDARLGGAKKPAMSVFGSGCHGITATLPIAVVAERMGVGEERLARAIALSLLLTIYIKAYSGRLSAFCGCAVTAAVGASAGIVYLLSGDDKQIGYAIKNMAADVTGIICDGANLGCALKTSTGAGAAIRAALLALKGVVIPDDNGIVGKGVEETIKNIGEISSPGMLETNRVILDIMTRR